MSAWVNSATQPKEILAGPNLSFSAFDKPTQFILIIGYLFAKITLCKEQFNKHSCKNNQSA